MAWPIALIAELASRRCIAFLGAGASAGSLGSDGVTRPPLWRHFLETLKAAMPAGTDPGAINDLISKDRYLDAAEIIVSKIAPADLTRIVREQFVQPRFNKSRIHEAILSIDPKIVVTTNYDDIYDSYCRNGLATDGYNICKYYEEHLVNDLRSPVRLIVKAHGCVSDASRIVLTRSQYYREKQIHGSFYSILDALFLTNTLLFIGYSLSDPDIQLVLENASISARSSHSHYALVEDSLQSDIENAARNAYNIHFIKYPAGRHELAEEMLLELDGLVTTFRENNRA